LNGAEIWNEVNKNHVQYWYQKNIIAILKDKYQVIIVNLQAIFFLERGKVNAANAKNF